jgi:hypothetical protein
LQTVVESPPSAEPNGYSPDADALEATEVVYEAPEQVDQVANSSQEGEIRGSVVYPPIDERSMHTFRSSPKSRSRFGSFGSASGPLSIRVKLGAVAGWSSVAAVGAAVILMNPGPLIGVRLAELGAIWGAISALVWFLPGKLIK